MPSVFSQPKKEEPIPIKKKTMPLETREKAGDKIKQDQEKAILETATKQIPPPEVKKVEPPKAPVAAPKAPVEPYKAPAEQVEEDEEEEETVEVKKVAEVPAEDVQANLKQKGLWDASDDDSEDESKDKAPAKVEAPVAKPEPPKKVGFQAAPPRPSAGVT